MYDLLYFVHVFIRFGSRPRPVLGRVADCVRLSGVSVFVGFFFKQKTAYEMRISDWSSDVCFFRSLAEQHPVLPLGVGPVQQQLAGDRDDAVVAAGPPRLHPGPDVVDQRVQLATLTGDVEVEALLLCRRAIAGLAALAPGGHRDERLARAPTLLKTAGRPCSTE